MAQWVRYLFSSYNVYNDCIIMDAWTVVVRLFPPCLLPGFVKKENIWVVLPVKVVSSGIVGICLGHSVAFFFSISMHANEKTK